MIVDRFAALSLNFSSVFGIWQAPLTTSHDEAKLKEFDWDDVTPQPSFQWHTCFGDLKCARLQVPMDWQGNSEENDKTVELAVVKVEATVPVTDPTYGGAVVLNPGGPGGSGVGQVIRGGKHVRTILSAGPEDDHSTARNFDIIGFDPRGINNTTPVINCFPNRLADAVWTLENTIYGYIGISDTSYDNQWASQRALAEGCSKRAAEQGIGKHVSTAPVARDIVEIFERHGEWRDEEAKRLVFDSKISTEEAAILDRTAWEKGEEKIQYWGFSYGTILGAHLSAMFPEKIGRAVLDGVADSFDYMRGGWSTNLPDTDLIFVKLTEYCWQAGPSNCPLYHEDGPAVIAGNVQKTMSHFRHNPIAIPGNSTRGPGLVTYSDLMQLILEIVYNPLRGFPITAQVLNETSHGEGTALLAWKNQQKPEFGRPLTKECIEEGAFSSACGKDYEPAWQATYGIACTDGLPRTKQTKEEFREYADSIIAQSSLIGASWASIQLPCTAWNIRPEWRYEGEFHAETAHPILFIGNTIDPVTPLRNAFAMAKGFKGAGVLHQDSEGHCTYSSPSMCSGRALRTYFQSGELPGQKSWSVSQKAPICEPDRLPFDGYTDEDAPKLPEGETDADLWEALVALNRVWP